MNELLEAGLMIEIGNELIKLVCKEAGIPKIDIPFYLEQVEMDNIGYGINE